KKEYFQLNRDASRADVLLTQMFPAHVADALKRGEKVKPEEKENVTIFFSDIVNFTSISSRVSADKISHMLNTLYTAFDALVEKHGIYKLETIGDAYMAAANLVLPQEEDHALRVAGFALDAVEAASNILLDDDQPQLGTVTLRVGIHSGPVVASLIGTQKLKYTLFGDTMNVSSRMESSSLPGKIQCSKVTILRGADSHIIVTERGEIPIKGKGIMTTY
ncbi:hypothetical protein GUITHDRAFT_47105, partial [Guillardia theta CCMP2712]